MASSPNGSFLQSWEWGDWQQSLGREVYRYLYLDENNKPIVSVQLIKMPLPLGQYYLYAPYGPVFAEGENFQFPCLAGRQAISNFQKDIKEKFPETLFVRIEPKFLLSTSHYPLVTKSPNVQPGKTLLINLAQTEEELLAQMHHKTRYNIRLAQKHEVEIKDEFNITIGHGLFAQEAAGLIVETANRQGYKAYGKDYYEHLIDFFTVQNRSGLKVRIYKAIYQNKLLASAIMVDWGKTRTFLFGGSAEENKNVMAPYLMHWRAMGDAKKQGLNFYDFWGTETSSGQLAGFVRFKLGFGGQEITYAGAYDLIQKKWAHKLYKVLKKIRH
ncbi:MAG: peptidoglycan bridge formation glycyltransferase FemA/FemB family protein [Candidatus Doudnabacteria bacterium]|nr:peptidoglycan bridge formation glycyltransferase FemA/FemB family protein [Candidatus Doudnabacteria bacterium]